MKGIKYVSIASIRPAERHRPAVQVANAFTLIEILVACTIMALLLVLLLSIVNQVTAMWANTTGSVQQFQRAREAFDIMTGRLSQATLNTFWDYRRAANGDPLDYVRQSELRFRSGEAAALVNGNGATYPSQAIFFQAPGGLSANGTVRLPGALSTWGYFIEYGSDKDYRPSFLNGKVPERYRFRLVEMMEPSDDLSIYQYTSGTNTLGAKNLNYTGNEWYKLPFGVSSTKRVLAENVVALVVLPKLPPGDDATGARLAPKYSYDTTETKGDADINPKNQLPPLIEVTIVAVDERGVARLHWESSTPNLGISTIFKDAEKSQRLEDLNDLEDNLRDLGLTPRRFSVTVPLRGAKWSTQQTE